jgi:hypothetical protein
VAKPAKPFATIRETMNRLVTEGSKGNEDFALLPVSRNLFANFAVFCLRILYRRKRRIPKAIALGGITDPGYNNIRVNSLSARSSAFRRSAAPDNFPGTA